MKCEKRPYWWCSKREQFLAKRNHFFKGSPELDLVLQFLAVGFLGFLTNMTLLTIALHYGIDVRFAIMLGITASTIVNFVFDRGFVFPHARRRAFLGQFMGFALVCLCGATLNFACATELLYQFPQLLPQLAELGGILVGTTFNYLFLRLLIFKH